MSKRFVHTGTSIDEVTMKTARDIASHFLLANKDWFTEHLQHITGQPVDWGSETAPVDVRIFMDAFAQGVSVCLKHIITGKLDLQLIKEEIKVLKTKP